MAKYDPHTEQKQQDCLELYLKYNGGEHKRIEQEMRQQGWPRFSRRILHNRNHRGRHEPGWIDKLGWRDKLVEQFLEATASSRDWTASDPLANIGSSDVRAIGVSKDTAYYSTPASTPAAREITPEPHHAGGTGVGKRDACGPVDAVNAFHAWIKRVSPNFDWDAPHHKYLCEQLERVSRGECKRLIINIPPRHGKSELVTVRYSAWRLKEDPATKVIIASYGQKLASRFSRGVRRMLSDDWAIGKLETGAASETTTGAASIPACDAGSSGVNDWRADILPASVHLSSTTPDTVTTVAANNNTVTLTSSSEFITNGCGSRLTDTNRHHAGGTDEASRDARRSSHNAGGTGVASKGACTPVEDENPFPFIKARLKNTESEWETTKGGGLRAVGVGGGVTGFGANLVIIDDPIKSRAEAESKNKREAVWNWFNDDIYTRLEPDGAIILIQTRWHEDDLAGRLIKNMNEEDGEHWEVINLPAIAMAASGVEEKRSGGDRETVSEPGAIATGFPNAVVKPANLCVDSVPETAIRPSFKPRVIGYPRLYSHLNDDAGNADALVGKAGSSGLTPLPEDKLIEPSHRHAGGTGVAGGGARVPVCTTSPLRLHSSSPHLSRDPLDRVPGDALWPKRYPVAKLEKTQYQIGTYSFSSLYQQEPVPREGGMFKRVWFDRIISAAPPGLRWVRGYDLGVTANATSDYTASLRVAFDKNENMYIDGGFRRRMEFPEQRRYILERILAERDTEHCVEGTHNGEAVVQDILKYQPRLSRVLRSIKVKDPKTARAIPWINAAEQGRLCLVRGPWNEEFIDEACSFPLGTHDDQVDAVSLAVKRLKEAKYKFLMF